MLFFCCKIKNYSMTAKNPKVSNLDTRALARLITGIESRNPAALRRLTELSKNITHKSRIIGVTGPPGAGKSTLIDGMIKRLRENNNRVGVVAIDPSSPFSGGALLGDRIRMQEHAGDEGVFIRSVGSRGSHGGLSRATRDIVRSMLGYDFDCIIVETVGVGQTEFDIMEIADATIVVLVPESGDMIQTMKAGLLEIADIFVVNKADRGGAEQMKNWLTGMFDSGIGLDAEAIAHHGAKVSEFSSLRVCELNREIPILLTQANKDKGVDELMKAVESRLKLAENDKRHKERKAKMLEQEFFEMCAEEFKNRLESKSKENKELGNLVSRISNGKVSPYEGLKIIDKFIQFKK